MADWNEREIEDIVFGKFGKKDDHRVAHRHGRPVKEPLASGDILVTGTSEDSKVSKTKGVWRKEGSNICPSLEIGNSRIVAGLDSNTCSTSYPIGASRGTVEEIGICQLSFDNNTTADSKLTFLENDSDRENDLLYYDWSDISNFEDVDTMFRNCDPTFGQWSNTDGQSWISSSSNDIFDPEDTVISGFESSTLEFRDFNDASAYCANISSLPESNTSEVNNHRQSCLAHQSFELLRSTEQPYDGGGVSETKSAITQFGNVNSLNECEQPHVNIRTEQLSRQYPSEVEGKGFEPYQSQILPKHNCFMKSDPSSYMPAPKHDAHIEDKLLYQDLVMPTASSSINECQQNPSSSFEISAQAISDTSHGMENLPDLISKDPVMHLKEMVEKPSTGPLELANSVEEEQPDNLEQMIVSGRGNMGLELNASDMDFTVGKSSSMPSVFSEDASVKAISFQQLQDVIGQLDLTTRLCIRDSLYRLARSAEQRRSFAAANNENNEGCGRGVHGTPNLRKSAAYVDMETETNPIDRSVANLLFHRQPESANRFADDAMSLESQMTA